MERATAGWAGWPSSPDGSATGVLAHGDAACYHGRGDRALGGGRQCCRLALHLPSRHTCKLGCRVGGALRRASRTAPPASAAVPTSLPRRRAGRRDRCSGCSSHAGSRARRSPPRPCCPSWPPWAGAAPGTPSSQARCSVTAGAAGRGPGERAEHARPPGSERGPEDTAPLALCRHPLGTRAPPPGPRLVVALLGVPPRCPGPGPQLLLQLEVNCSKGAAQLGTFLALEQLLQQAGTEGAVDVFTVALQQSQACGLMTPTLVSGPGAQPRDGGGGGGCGRGPPWAIRGPPALRGGRPHHGPAPAPRSSTSTSTAASTARSRKGCRESPSPCCVGGGAGPASPLWPGFPGRVACTPTPCCEGQ